MKRMGANRGDCRKTANSHGLTRLYNRRNPRAETDSAAERGVGFGELGDDVNVLRAERDAAAQMKPATPCMKPSLGPAQRIRWMGTSAASRPAFCTATLSRPILAARSRSRRVSFRRLYDPKKVYSPSERVRDARCTVASSKAADLAAVRICSAFTPIGASLVSIRNKKSVICRSDTFSSFTSILVST